MAFMVPSADATDIKTARQASATGKTSFFTFRPFDGNPSVRERHSCAFGTLPAYNTTQGIGIQVSVNAEKRGFPAIAEAGKIVPALASGSAADRRRRRRNSHGVRFVRAARSESCGLTGPIG
jgi:hypothetical protein